MQPAGVVHPPIIREIAIEDNYAVALWDWGEAGTWIISAESGGWNNARGLIGEGVPKKTAQRLAKDVGMSEQ